MAFMSTAKMLTRADLDALPDDNLRHELIDGQFVMTPAPGFGHQQVVGAIYRLLWDATRGTEMLVLTAPFDVVLGPNVVEPDVLVARCSDFTERDLPVAPVLVVEVLSPSTTRIDGGRKRDLYAESGVAHYWMIDPDEPAVTILTLVDGGYVEAARATADAQVTINKPVALRFTPAELLDG